MVTVTPGVTVKGVWLVGAASTGPEAVSISTDVAAETPTCRTKITVVTCVSIESVTLLPISSPYNKTNRLTY